ncbi:MAG: hypothetical protein HKP27_11845 [Myxococcales bacterium]|nr:hypothetical protein [Myxococcales bacterium]
MTRVLSLFLAFAVSAVIGLGVSTSFVDRLYGDGVDATLVRSFLGAEETLLRKRATVGEGAEFFATVDRASDSRLHVDLAGDRLEIRVHNPTSAPVLSPGALHLTLSDLDWDHADRRVLALTERLNGLDARGSFEGDTITIALGSIAYAPGTATASFDITAGTGRMAGLPPISLRGGLGILAVLVLLGCLLHIRRRNASHWG